MYSLQKFRLLRDNLDNFVHGNNVPTLFVVGNKGGLTEVRQERE